MAKDPNSKLVDATRAQFQAARLRALPLLQAETRLRKELATLEQQRRASSQDASSLDLVRKVGGDSKWEIWVARRQRQLNMELARCLSEKHAIDAQLRKLHGRVLAAEAIQQKALAERRKAEQKYWANTTPPARLPPG